MNNKKHGPKSGEITDTHKEATVQLFSIRFQEQSSTKRPTNTTDSRRKLGKTQLKPSEIQKHFNNTVILDKTQ